LHRGITAGAPGGKNKGQAKQSLFLIYLDALSVVNSKRATKDAPQQQAEQQQQFEQQLQLVPELSSAAPNMQDFSIKDLQFVLTFTGA
jgi:hypothetical protein